MTIATKTDRAAVNGVELAYDTFGDKKDSPIVLVMGLATQRLAWSDELCEALASCGHFVVRFDNRDVGESTHLRELGRPGWSDLLLRRRPPYTIRDMATDTVELMTHLGLDDAHIVGASMGGFIAQTVALKFPERVRSLTLIMTSTGSRLVGNAKPKVYAALLRRQPVRSRDDAIAATMRTFQLIGSPGYALDRESLGRMAGQSYDRGFNPSGYIRQLAAIMSQPDRTKRLRQIKVPTLVLHGLADPLVAPSGGRALAKAIPGARFVGFPGMGHDLPRQLWDRFVEEICAVATQADESRGTKPSTKRSTKR